MNEMQDNKYLYILGKLLKHGGSIVLIWIVIRRFSPVGSYAAGWFAGLAGASYLLAGWIQYLKSRGTDLAALLRGSKHKEVPYYLKGPEKWRKTRLSLTGKRHVFNDDLEDLPADAHINLNPISKLRCRAVAFAILGLLLFGLSFY